MPVLLYLHWHVELCPIRNADVGAIVIGVLALRLSVNTVAAEGAPQTGKQHVSATILVFGIQGSTMAILVPVLVPIDGVVPTDLDGKSIQLIHHQGCQVSSVGRSFVAESLSDLINGRLSVVGIPVDDSLLVSDSLQEHPPL